MIDPKSQEFIKWTQDRYKDEQCFWDDVAMAIAELDAFYCRDAKVIQGKLYDKLKAGAVKHGAPVYPPGVVEKELEMEYLDILGWYAVRTWNRENKNKEKSN